MNNPDTITLNRRLQLEEIVSAISTRFINLPLEDFEQGIHEMLGTIGAFVGADRSYIFLYDDNDDTMSCVFEWCAAGITAEIANLQDLPRSMFPWWNMTMQSQQVILAPRLDDLPPEAAAEKEILAAQNIQSVLVVPLPEVEQIAGFMGFDAVLQETDWSSDDIRLLRIVSEIITNALQRKATLAALSESEERFRTLFTNSADAVLLVENSIITDCNRAALEILGVDSFYELHGRKLWDYSPPQQPDGQDSKAKAQVLIDEALRTGSQRFEWVYQRRDDISIAVEVVLTAMQMQGKQILHTVWRDITERKQAEHELARYRNRLEKWVDERSAELYRATQRVEAILNNSSDGIALAYTGTGIVQTNFTFNALFGCEPDEYFGMPLVSLVHPDDADRLIEMVDTVVQNRTGMHIELRAVRKNGSVVEVEFGIGLVITNYSPDDMRGHGLVCSIRDITERKQAEEALHTSEKRYRSLFEQTHDGVFYLTLEGRHFAVNQRASEMLGYTDQEIIGQSYRDVVVPEQVEDSNHIVERLLQGEILPVYERKFRRKDGTVFPVEISVQLVRDSRENPVYIQSVVRDITQRKRAEKALSDSEERYRSVVDSIKEVIFHTNAGGIWTFLNPAWEEITGFSVQESLGLPSLDYVHPDDRQRHLEEFAPLLKREKGFCRHVVRYLTKDGGFRWIEVFARLTIAETGQTNGIAGTLMDITEHKQAEDALLQALEKERELSELKSRFVSMVSHEFRTPLATIQVTADNIRYYIHRLDETQIARRFNKIQAQIRHMTTLLEDVLTFGRIQAEKLEFNPVPTRLDPFCRDILEDLQNADDTAHPINYSCADPNLEACVDPKLLRQIITNLLTNAIKYSPPEYTVQFDIGCQDGAVVLRVADSGIGIPEADQSRLFEAFYRATNVGHVSGTGLGLVITKHAVELHQGCIDFVSEPGVGTTFTVTLPNERIQS